MSYTVPCDDCTPFERPRPRTLRWCESGECGQPYCERCHPENFEPEDDEVETFLREYDEGKHQLSPEDEATLEASREDLNRRLRAIFGTVEESEP